MKKNSIIFSLVLTTFIFLSCETDDVKPYVSLSADKTLISEDSGEAIITLSITNSIEKDVTVILNVAGTATGDGIDYTLSNKNVIIKAGTTSTNVTLTAIQDDVLEENEEVEITINSVEGANLVEGQKVTIVIEDDDTPVQPNLLINEVLYDPSNSALAGDANGDGVYAQNEDEFIELINYSSKSVDISGFKIYDAEALTAGVPRHIFPANTIIPAGKCIVIFGGGTPTGTFGGSIVQTSTTGDLNLNNAGDMITITDTQDEVLATFDITPFSDNPNESYTRNPDISGDFVQHHVANSNLLFSPGTKIDGTSF